MVSENKREIEKVLWETADKLTVNTGPMRLPASRGRFK